MKSHLVRMGLLMTLMLACLGCAEHHGRPGNPTGVDAGPSSSDAGAIPSGEDASVVRAPPRIPCGFNECRDGEICCSELCGICTTAATCRPDVLCQATIVLVCDQITCDRDAQACCPSCDGTDVCPPAAVGGRGTCPPLECD